MEQIKEFLTGILTTALWLGLLFLVAMFDAHLTRDKDKEQ